MLAKPCTTRSAGLGQREALRASSAGRAQFSSPPSKVVPILISKLRKAYEASQSLVRLDLGYLGCGTVRCVVAPKGQQPRRTSERLGNCWLGLSYDAVDHSSSTVSNPIHRQNSRVVSAFRDSDSEQNRLGSRAAHRAAPKISTETMARHSFGCSLQEPGAKLRQEPAEHLSEAVRIGEKNGRRAPL
jgi:hypothetical protein